ncbi:hypothetical protein G4B88_027460 [Cannabis sativa]|uniref:RNase H type-1 domain-containing protein n=1 Tax=Cannabis sativa TaxID=3483 RepID=A0A7J6FTZ4_CANSA|nr:hypothetical protein G4B88_027460 [Cannabis sativa]
MVSLSHYSKVIHRRPSIVDEEAPTPSPHCRRRGSTTVPPSPSLSTALSHSAMPSIVNEEAPPPSLHLRLSRLLSLITFKDLDSIRNVQLNILEVGDFPSEDAFAKDYHEAQHNNLDGLSVPVSQQLTHHPQSFSVDGFHEDSTALFVDAALDHNQGLTGIEGQALMQGISWCIASQLKPDFIFSDCQNLVSKVNGVWKDHSALSGLVFQIRLLFSNFPDDSLLHLIRQFNTTTHSLAKEAFRLREEAHEELF